MTVESTEALEGLIRQSVVMEVAESRCFWRVYDGLDERAMDAEKEELLEVKIDEENHLATLLDIARSLDMSVDLVKLYDRVDEEYLADTGEAELRESVENLLRINRRSEGFYDKLHRSVMESPLEGVDRELILENLESVVESESLHSQILRDLLEDERIEKGPKTSTSSAP